MALLSKYGIDSDPAMKIRTQTTYPHKASHSRAHAISKAAPSADLLVVRCVCSACGRAFQTGASCFCSGRWQRHSTTVARSRPGQATHAKTKYITARSSNQRLLTVLHKSQNPFLKTPFLFFWTKCDQSLRVASPTRQL